MVWAKKLTQWSQRGKKKIGRKTGRGYVRTAEKKKTEQIGGNKIKTKSREVKTEKRRIFLQ